VVKDLEPVLEGDVHTFLVPVARAKLGRDMNDRRTFPLPGSTFLTAGEAGAGRRVRRVVLEWRSCRRWHSKHTDRSQTLCCDDELILLDMVAKHRAAVEAIFERR